MADDEAERSPNISQMATSQKGVYHQIKPDTQAELRVPIQQPSVPLRPSRSRAQQNSQRIPLQKAVVTPVSPSQHINRRSSDSHANILYQQINNHHSSPKPGVVNLPAGSRGPRSLYIRRDGDSFGFTLRHFIVYPPDSVTHDDTRHAAVGALCAPMETIFVRSVSEGSPAAKAGLQCGDRLVAVNGQPLSGLSYQQTVQLIQHSPPYLHLLVVPQKDDVLQKFFPEAAHNPETNTRPKRYASPETYGSRRHSNELKYRPINHPRASDSISWRSYEEPIYNTPDLRQKSTIIRQNRDSRSSEGIYCDPKDVLTYRPIRVQSNRNSIQSRDSFESGSNIYSEPLSHDFSERPRAQPQVPIYTKMGRRASEGSNISENNSNLEIGECISDNYSDMVNKMKSASKVAYPEAHTSFIDSCGLQGINYANNAGCRLSLDAGRRESSASLNSSLADGSKDSLSSYDSASTLTGHDIDDSIIMTRFRKTIEKKEEFLKRPNQPINWKPPDDFKLTQTPVIQREFYGRPQKLQKEWPPNDPNLLNGQEVMKKPLHTNFQRVKIDIDSERDYVVPNGKDGKAENQNQNVVQNSAQFQVGGLVSVSPLQRNSNIRQSKDKSFISTLSRIHETNPENLDKYTNGTSSLPSSEDERKYHNLQIVSRRTKQFESGRPVPEDENELLSDRTNFYRSEIARLSAKRVVPNVAVRKREFETLEIENNRDYRRDRDRRAQRESRSLDHSGKTTSVPSKSTSELNSEENFKNTVSGNLIVPIGSHKIHCDPPKGSKVADVPLENENLQVQLRARSNSAESWTAAMQNANSSSNRNRKTLDCQLINETDEKQRNRVLRQDSYLTALKSKIPDQDRKKQSVVIEESMEIGPQNSSEYSQIVPNNQIPYQSQKSVDRMLEPLPSVSITPPPKNVPTRPNKLNITSPIQPAPISDTEFLNFGELSATRLSASPVPGDVPQVIRRTKNNNANSTGDEDRATRRVSYLKATWGDRMHIESDLDLSDTEGSPHALGSRSTSGDGSGSLSSPERENQLPVIKESALSCKFMELEGKRATDRSWHKVWAVLKGPKLYLYKDRHHHHQSPMGLVTDQQLPGGVDMRYSVVDVADDYTKRKNVLKISSALPYRTELLLQADGPIEMADWVRTLQEQTGASTENEEKQNTSEHKQAVPQTIPAATSVQVQGTARLSPQPSSKTKTSSSSRNRSPTGQSPKSKTWRGRVVKQFKKLNQGSGSPNSPTTPEKLTFGIPLENCVQSENMEYVPKFVKMCTDIIEERGLEVIGIYRVPGNSAAVTALTEELDKGINFSLQDTQCDTNVVSSLLKSFFRKLPDPLLTSELYPRFIEADKIDDPKSRLREIKNILSDLPIYQYETLKHLILHLKKVMDNSEINKMEARNLAIMFGPTLVRTVEDNMVTMVTDMSHQCRIVESLLLYAEWFFSDDDSDISLVDTNLNQDSGSAKFDNTSATVNNTLLLGNISKIEGIKESTTRENTKKVVSSIISAANRKIQRKPRKSTEQPTSPKEPLTPTIESKEAALSLSSLSPTHVPEEQKTVTSLDSEESSNSDNVTAEDPLLMTYKQRDARHHERIEKFKQETMAMLQKKRRTTDMTWDGNIPPRASIESHSALDEDQIDSGESQTGSDLVATMTSILDNKMKALQSPLINSLTTIENIPFADETPEVQIYEVSIIKKPLRESQKQNEQPQVNPKPIIVTVNNEKSSPKYFRDPSLHKSSSTSNFNGKNSTTEKNDKKKNEVSSEKDIDETVKEKSEKTRLSDELNELCKINNFKELKCSASDSKLKRSESLNKTEENRENEPEHGKLKRSVSLNRAANLRRSDSLTKYEKTESNINLRRELVDTNRKKKSTTKLKRKNGMPERSIKRRHTVGGTKDFDKLHWLDNKLRYEAEQYEEKEKALRSSSPDLSCGDKLPLESHI